MRSSRAYFSVSQSFIFSLETQFQNIWGQFHQHSTHSFYVQKLLSQLFCAYILGLYFTGVSLLAQKLRVEHDEIEPWSLIRLADGKNVDNIYS